MTARLGRFIAVGAGGLVLQLALLVCLTRAGWAVVPATALAVEAAVLHNFWWHQRWTWRDRTSTVQWTHRLLRFHAATGLVSLVGTVSLTWGITAAFALSAAEANVLAVGTASLANFVAADRWVFGGTA